jgi:Leucine-rich repeat (LRR) protein
MMWEANTFPAIDSRTKQNPMLKKIINLLNGNKQASTAVPETTGLPPEKPMVDYKKYIRGGSNYFHFTDPLGELESLADDFFEGHEHVENIRLQLKNVVELPTSMNRFTQLKNIDLYCSKLKQLPSFIFENEHLTILQIYCPQLRIDDQFLRLKNLTQLQHLSLTGYFGNKWPTQVEALAQLRQLTIGFDEKKTDQLEMLRGIGKMKNIKELHLRGELNLALIGGHIKLIDHLDILHAWGKNPQNSTEFLEWGLLRHVSFRLNYHSGEMTFDDFKAAIQKDDFDDDTRKLLYSVFAKNLTAAKAILPNYLLEAQEKGQTASFHFAYKPAKELLNRAKEQGGNGSVRLLEQPETDSFYIIGQQNQFREVLELLRSGKKILLEDHLKEWLTAVEDPWLLQTESQEANEQVYRLLTSNQAENYLLAFQIIEGGGANDELVSMIAAVMLSHPDQKVAKAAEKLFVKVGPSSTLTVFKQKKISLRRSGDTVKTLNRLFQADIGIPATPFRLMHGLIAGENPVIKDVQPNELSFKDCQFNEPFPNCARFFEHFTSVDFSRSKGLDLAGALHNLMHWAMLRRLDFSGCHFQIPASIGSFSHLTHLDLASNVLEDTQALGLLTNLVELSVEGCKIKAWQWLEKLDSLETINMARNELPSLPKELASMTGLRSLSLKQNKLKTIEEALFSLYSLSNLDLSNNQISKLDYRIFSKFPLHKLSLRSNKISQFDPVSFKAATGGRPCIVWELNMASNALTAFKVEKDMFSRLSDLDISKNKITELDDGIFRFTGVKNLSASNNQITSIPPSIAGKFMQKLSLDKNQIKELPEHFSTTRVEYCDLRFNKITSIPSSFKRKVPSDLSKAYWQLDGNPVGRYGLFQ